MKERIYAVHAGKTSRLVRARSRAQALTHVAQSMFIITVADQEELVTLLGDGVKVENAKNPDQTEMELE